jgi:hypothetical protein
MIKLQLLSLVLLMQTLSAETPSSIETETTEYLSLEDGTNYDFHDDTYESFTPDMEKAVSKEKISKNDYSTTYEIRHGNIDISATVENPNAPPDWEEEWHKNGCNKKCKTDSKESSYSNTSKKERDKRKKGSSFSLTWSSKD